MKVSVLVPVYNKSRKELRRCFESVLRQTCSDFELIIIDDGSEPGLAAFLDDYAEANKGRCAGGVRCFHYPNGGVWQARNRGQEKASGEWIMHVNADDFISPVTVETALDAAGRHESIDMVYWGLWDVNWPPYLYKGCGGDRLYAKPTKERFNIRQDYLCATPFCDVTCLVRREKTLPFNPELTGAEFEHQVRVTAGCRAIFFIDRPFYNYVSGPDTISVSQADIRWRIASINDFREALVSHKFETVDEYLAALALRVIHHAAEHDFSIYREIRNSVVGEILRSMPLKDFGRLTRKMKIICALFKARQFFLLGALLRFAGALKKGEKSRKTEMPQNPDHETGLPAKHFHPLVSVVIPVYNGADYLREAIDSAFTQTYDNIEIIVVNDGSTDDTERVALSYGDRIRYFAKENGGTATALNTGIANMRGEYFAWLSHDDLYYPKKIEREVEELSRLSNKDTLLCCDWHIIDANYRRIGASLGRKFVQEHPPREKSRMFPVLYAKIHGCAALIPKACFEAVGLFDANLRMAHDYDLFRRILRQFPRRQIPEVLAVARDGANRQGKRAVNRCNVEYSLLLIDIIEQLTEEEILEMADKRDFYLYLGGLYQAAGFTIAVEYLRMVAASLGYVKEKTGGKFPGNNIFKRFFRALKIYGLKETMKKIPERLGLYFNR